MNNSLEYYYNLDDQRKSEFVNELIDKRKKKYSQNTKKLYEQRRVFPLSAAQTGIWFYEQIYHSSKYTVCAYAQIVGKLDKSKLFNAIQKVVQYHDIFRIKIEVDKEGIPYLQENRDKGAVDFKMINLSSDKEVASFIRTASNYIFQLDQEPLYRFSLIQKSEDEYYLVILMHHLITDELTVELIIKDIYGIYSKTAFNQLPSDYLHYCADNQKKEIDLSYWKHKLTPDKLHFLNLGKNMEMSGEEKYENKLLKFTIPTENMDELIKLCSGYGYSVFTGIYAAFAISLYLQSGHSSIITSTTFSDRIDPKYISCYGMFVYNELMHMDIAFTDTFLQILEKANKELLSTYENSSRSFSEIIRMLQIDSKYLELQNHIVLTFVDNDRRSMQNMSLIIKPVQIIKKVESNHLNFLVEKIEGRYHGNIYYSTRYASEEFIQNLKDNLFMILEKGVMLSNEPLIDLLNDKNNKIEKTMNLRKTIYEN